MSSINSCSNSAETKETVPHLDALSTLMVNFSSGIVYYFEFAVFLV